MRRMVPMATRARRASSACSHPISARQSRDFGSFAASRRGQEICRVHGRTGCGYLAGARGLQSRPVPLGRQVMDQVVFADPSNQEARSLAADAFEQLDYLAESSTWRNAYLLGAQELRSDVSGAT